MANALIDENTMTAIADAIRGAAESDEKYLPKDMPEGIKTGVAKNMVRYYSDSKHGYSMPRSLEENGVISSLQLGACADYMEGDAHKAYILFDTIFSYPSDLTDKPEEGIITTGYLFAGSDTNLSAVNDTNLEGVLAEHTESGVKLTKDIYLYQQRISAVWRQVALQNISMYTTYGVKRYLNFFSRVNHGGVTKTFLAGWLYVNVVNPLDFGKYTPPESQAETEAKVTGVPGRVCAAGTAGATEDPLLKAESGRGGIMP